MIEHGQFKDFAEGHGKIVFTDRTATLGGEQFRLVVPFGTNAYRCPRCRETHILLKAQPCCLVIVNCSCGERFGLDTEDRHKDLMLIAIETTTQEKPSQRA